MTVSLYENFTTELKNFNQKPYFEKQQLLVKFMNAVENHSLNLLEKYKILMALPEAGFLLPVKRGYSLGSLFIVNNHHFKFTPTQSFNVLNKINLDSFYSMDEYTGYRTPENPSPYTGSHSKTTLAMTLTCYNKNFKLNSSQLVKLFKKCDLQFLDSHNQTLGYHIAKNNMPYISLNFHQFLEIYNNSPKELMQKDGGLFYLINHQKIHTTLFEVNELLDLLQYEIELKNHFSWGTLEPEFERVGKVFEKIKTGKEVYKIIHDLNIKKNKPQKFL